MVNRCFRCGRPFGLVRSRYRGNAFCTHQCMEAYKEGKPPDQPEKVIYKPPEDELTPLLRYP